MKPMVEYAVAVKSRVNVSVHSHTPEYCIRLWVFYNGFLYNSCNCKFCFAVYIYWVVQWTRTIYLKRGQNPLYFDLCINDAQFWKTNFTAEIWTELLTKNYEGGKRRTEVLRGKFWFHKTWHIQGNETRRLYSIRKKEVSTIEARDHEKKKWCDQYMVSQKLREGRQQQSCKSIL